MFESWILNHHYAKATSFWLNNDVIIASWAPWDGARTRMYEVILGEVFDLRHHTYFWWLNCDKIVALTLHWRHNEHDSVSNHQPYDCLLNRLFRRTSKKTSKPRVTGLCAGNSPVTDEFPAQRASNAENVSIWWRHHEVRTVAVPFLPACVAISSAAVVLTLWTKTVRAWYEDRN